MLLSILKSKLHKAAVTECALHYEGSIAIDCDLMKKIDLLPYEKVMVANLENGNRFETYAIVAPAGSGTICLNGAAAYQGSVGDRIIIMAFAQMKPSETRRHLPKVLVLDSENRPIKDSRKRNLRSKTS